MTITVEQVRTRLKDLPTAFVSDDTIKANIEDAEFIVYQERSAYTPDEVLQKATLIIAVYKTALVYASELERELGTLPPWLDELLARYKMEADLALTYVKRGRREIVGVPQLTESSWDYRGTDTYGTEAV